MPCALAARARAVGTDLVGHVSVRRDPVGPDDHAGDVAQPEPAGDHPVADEGAIHTCLSQLPGSEPAPLQKRAGFRDHYVG